MAQKELMADTEWYAACETGHPFWAGDYRKKYDDAQKDATAHDNKKHGGDPTAVVLQKQFARRKR